MSQSACFERVQKGDPDRFLATLAAPKTCREDLLTLYALNLEVARVPWLTKETMIAEMRLQWWRDVVAEPMARAHEVAAPVHDLIQRANLPVDVLDQMIAARLWDIYPDPFEDLAAFDLYIDHTSGHLMWLAALICGAPPICEGTVRDFAFAAGIANYLRAVPDLESRGRRPLVDGRAPAVRDLAQRALDRLSIARQNRRRLVQAAPALLAGWQAQGLLKQAVAEPSLVGRGALGLSEFSRRKSLAWQAITGRF